MPKPLPATYPAYYDRYIKLVEEDELPHAFARQQSLIDEYFPAITEEESRYAYAEDKWTLKEMLQHIIDTERIFACRSLCFARQEMQSLPGFEENDYARHSNANARKWQLLCDELKVVRASSLLLFESFTEAMLETSGIANKHPASTLSMGFTMIGHIYHHRNIIEERYR